MQLLQSSLASKESAEDSEIENESDQRELVLLQLQSFVRDSVDEVGLIVQVQNSRRDIFEA